ALAAVEPFDGSKLALDARPIVRLLDRHRFRDYRGRFGDAVAGQPFAAAAQPPAPHRHLHHQTTVLTLNRWHRLRVPVFRVLLMSDIYQISGSPRLVT